jgi:AcrR family transcriptional regulator
MPRPATALPAIESAALRLFVEKGVDATSVQDIARAAGVAQGALYRHYPGKDDLVWGLFRDQYVALAERLGALVAARSGAHARLAAIVDEFIRFHDEDATLFRFLLVVQHGELAKVTPATPSPVNVVRDAIAAAIRAGELPAQDPELAAALVLGALLQPATFAAYGRLPPRLAPHRDRLLAAAWRALQPA